MQILNKLIELGCEIKTNTLSTTNIIDKKMLDSFWYDGVVLEFVLRGKKYEVYAAGRIRIVDNENNIVYDYKERGAGIKGGLKTDKDLKKIGNEGDKGFDYFWIENNWFELTAEDEDEGEVFYTLDQLEGMVKAIKIIDFGEWTLKKC